MKLYELFDKPTTYSIIDEMQDYLRAVFKIGKHVFAVTFHQEKTVVPGEVWQVEFSKADTANTEIYHFDRTGDVREMSSQVFSTVIQIIKDFVNSKNVEYLVFTSDKKDKTRTTLYKNIIKKISKYPAFERITTSDVEQLYAIKTSSNAPTLAASEWERIK